MSAPCSIGSLGMCCFHGSHDIKWWQQADLQETFTGSQITWGCHRKCDSAAAAKSSHYNVPVCN